MGLEIAKTGVPVLYINTEMTDDEMLSRYASQVLNMDAFHLRHEIMFERMQNKINTI